MSTVKVAPGEKLWEDVHNLLAFSKKLEKRSRIDCLLSGGVFIELKRLYREYSSELYRSGYKKDEIMNYNQFKAESSFEIPSASTISNRTKVFAIYIIGYKMAKLEKRDHDLFFSWLDPLLTSVPFDMLYYLMKDGFHNTKERAIEILTTAANSKRSDFWRWLEQQPRVTPPVVSSSLIDECTPPDKPYQNSIQETVEPYQINAPDFWSKFMKDIEIPKTVKRPLRVTVTIDEIEYGVSGNNARDI